MINMKYFILWTDCASIFIVVLTPSKKWFPLGNIINSHHYTCHLGCTWPPTPFPTQLPYMQIISYLYDIFFATSLSMTIILILVKELCRLFNHAFAFVITRFLNCEHLILQKTIFLFYILRIFINQFSS